jgi:hypothetical protein
MDYSSLPTFPPPLPSRSAALQQRRGGRLTPRQARVLLDMAKLAGIVVLLVWLRHTADAVCRPAPPPPAPLPFEVVAERFARIHLMMPADEVFALLGPQRFEEFREPEMDDHHLLVWAHPDRYPEERYWAKWADPADRGRWVAVFICGGRVYKTLKRGV